MNWKESTGALLRAWAVMNHGDETKLPDKYLIIDLETTGLDPDKDLVVQLGICVVSPTDTIVSSTVIDTPMDKFSPDALEITGLTEEIIKTHGQPREKTLIEFEEFYNECVENGYVVVGHNILGFDGKFLTAEYKRIGKEFNVPHSAIDTGLIVKAAQLDLWPDDYESFRDFLLRVADIRARGIYWKLSGFCDEQFGLNDWLEDEEANTFVKQAHDAGADCLKVHLLLRRFKEYSNMISNGDVTIVEVDGAELFEELRQLCQSSCI